MNNFKTFITFVIIIVSVTCAWAQKTTITGTIENNKFTKADLQLLYKNDGVSFGKATVNTDGSFKLIATISKTDLYRLIFGENEQVMLCLTPNQNIELTLDANNLANIKNIKGSPSMEFYNNTMSMLASTRILYDSINYALQNDKDVLFYNELQSQFKPYLDANTEADAYCIQVAKMTDSLQSYVNAKTIKDKVDPKEIDAFVYTSSNLLKDITTNYTKYSNYLQSISLFYDFKTNRNKKFESFYTSSIDKYLEIIEQRNEKMKTQFVAFMTQVGACLYLRDSLQMNDLMNKKKEKELLAAKIVELAKMCPNAKETAGVLLSYAQVAEGYGKYTQQEAQRNVSTLVNKYQTLFDSENDKRQKAVSNYLTANKYDLVAIFLLDNYFPKDQNAELHKEIIKALYEKYPDHPIIAERYKVESAPASSTSVGALAPELAFENPEGKIMKLSDLRGKVVLLDFWASWCGPCRKENPNVVKVYHKYHDKGFEIYSVSLDRDKASWIKAIEADGLIWTNHVSDLGYWNSQGAKIYGVNSVPATFLIGKDGRIIAKNLRGGALENALKELFD